MDGTQKHTTSIDVYGPGLIALRLKDCVIVATNPIGRKYGTLRYRNLKRVTPLSDNLLFTCSGDYSDFQ